MTTFSTPIAFTSPSTGQKREFSSLEEVRGWAEEEKLFWAPLCTQRAKNEGLWRACQAALQFSDSLIGTISHIESLGDAGQAQAAQYLSPLVAQVTNGQTITRECRYAQKIRAISESNPRSALAAYASLVPGLEGQLNYHGIQPFEAFRIALEASLVEDALPSLRTFESEWSQLTGKISAQLKEQEDKASELATLSSSAARDEAARVEHQSSEWQSIKDEAAKDWRELRRVYDEQLALLAPTQYWSKRADSHKTSMIWLAISFGLLSIFATGAFLVWGVSALSEVPADASASAGFLALLPMLVPAFAVIWVMRILSRLLSESIGMMRDAKERETMVKTFLALLRDKADGQPGLTQDDRILILHSLFRPSSITATDDSPPVHWFDLLTKRLGQQGGGPAGR